MRSIDKDIKKKIILTASKLFFEQGYNNTGINELIKKSGIAKATLYNHFESKEDICVAYLQRRSSSMTNILEHTVLNKSNPNDMVISLFEYVEQTATSTNYALPSFIKITSEINPKENKKIASEINKHFKKIKIIIEKMVDRMSATIHINDKKILVDMILSLFLGTMVSAAVYKNSSNIASSRDFIIEFLNI